MKLRVNFDFWGWDIFCPGCRFCLIRVEEVWCGCRVPRKLKKQYKKLQAVYQEG